MAKEYVGVIPGEGWWAIFTSDDLKDRPVLAFRLRTSGELEGVDALGRNMAKLEYFSHYSQKNSWKGEGK